MKSAYISQRVFVDGPVEPACIVVQDGKILDIIRGDDVERFDRETVAQIFSNFMKSGIYRPSKSENIESKTVNEECSKAADTDLFQNYISLVQVDTMYNAMMIKFCKMHVHEDTQVTDVGNLVLMPGVVDCHVHVNEPGRSEWEGYITATKAAAAGGITTIIDMPLNSIPSTTTLAALEKKVLSAGDKRYVDVGFWGGIVPGNQDELLQMLSAGVMGFKCFLIHSGVDDFPAVTRKDLESAFQILQGIPAVVLFHAEVDCGCTDGKSKDAPEKYATFLESRSEEMEIEAIKMVCDLCLMYRVRCHIVHLSAASALPYIINAKSMGAPLTVETCHHYLSFEAESIPNKATQFKCCPPIRQKANQNALWDALKNGHIDMVVSDHSPCTPDLKLLEQGDFLKAWGGIASVQFGLSLFWTNAEDRGFTLADTVRLLCENTAKLANLEHRKGALKIGHDADFVIWDPDASYKVTTDSIHHRNKVTPYLGKELKGVVHMTVVRGRPVFKDGQLLTKPTGSYLFNEKTSPETLKSRFNCSFSYTGPNQEKILAIRRQV